jgi:hypothetical protein
MEISRRELLLGKTLLASILALGWAQSINENNALVKIIKIEKVLLGIEEGKIIITSEELEILKKRKAELEQKIASFRISKALGIIK